jgi:integrase
MSRRSGQRGYVEPKGNYWHVRYWLDTPDGRVHASEPICLAVGQGKKTRSEARRLGAAWLTSQGINTEEHLAAIGPQVTFSQQAEMWLEKLQSRNRNPIPETSVPSIRSALDKWLLPTLGSMPLSNVNNSALRGLVNKMKNTLSPKTINTYINMAKEVVESLVNEDGEPIFHRKWNNDFIDLPVVNRREQRRPKLNKQQIEAVINACNTDWERMLYVLCSSTGMRIAEALALDINENITIDCTAIAIRRQVKGNRLVQYLKTDAAYRDIDLCSELAAVLRNYIGKRKGLLFPSRTGRTPVSYSNLLHRSIHPKLVSLGLYTPGAAMHCFRRFRASVLKKNRCPEHLEKFWMGHQNRDITHEYAEQLQEDFEWRQEIANSIGVGFQLPNVSFVPKCTQIADAA